MEKFITLESTVVPLAIKDIDTDMIIPANFMTSVSKDGYGQYLFTRLKDQDPEFPFNKKYFADSKIIVADSNFGCGSSREHAVWAILDAGIKVVIAKSFADIFYNNSAKNGLLLIILPADIINKILVLATNGDYNLIINLESQTVITPDNKIHHFDYNNFRKHCLLNGLDDIDYINSDINKIKKFFHVGV